MGILVITRDGASTLLRASDVWRIVGAALGYPLGVFGTICVASITMTVISWIITAVSENLGLSHAGTATMSSLIGNGVFMGIYGGFIVGLVTGGPVFAVVALFRPVLVAWFWIFGMCTIASLVGLALDIESAVSGGNFQQSATWYFLMFPAIMLVVTAGAYMLCTTKQSNLRALNRGNARAVPPNHGAYRHVPRHGKTYYCPDCGYRALPTQDASFCAACGRARPPVRTDTIAHGD